MRRLGEDARRVLRDAGMEEAGALSEVTRVWPEAVGEGIARAAWPARIGRDGTLHVSTVSSTWAFELDRLAGQLAESLREALREDWPTTFRFAPGNVPEPDRDSAETHPGELPVPMEDDLREGSRLASGIADEELRKLVARAASASLARRRSDRSFW